MQVHITRCDPCKDVVLKLWYFVSFFINACQFLKSSDTALLSKLLIQKKSSNYRRWNGYWKLTQNVLWLSGVRTPRREQDPVLREDLQQTAPLVHWKVNIKRLLSGSQLNNDEKRKEHSVNISFVNSRHTLSFYSLGKAMQTISLLYNHSIPKYEALCFTNHNFDALGKSCRHWDIPVAMVPKGKFIRLHVSPISIKY